MLLKEAIDTYYHGTSRNFKIGEYITPPNEHGLEISEKGRKKNLDIIINTTPGATVFAVDKAKIMREL